MRHVLLPCRPELLALTLILSTITLTGCMRRHISVEEVDKMIQEQVPIGSDKQQVRAFIDNLKVDSLQIIRESKFHQATRRTLGIRDPEKIAELGDRIAEFTSLVISGAESDGVLTFNDIVINFYIDKDERMIGYTVKLRGAE